MGHDCVVAALELLVSRTQSRVGLGFLLMGQRQRRQLFAGLAALVFGQFVLVGGKLLFVRPDRAAMRLKGLTVFVQSGLDRGDLLACLAQLLLPSPQILAALIVVGAPSDMVPVHFLMRDQCHCLAPHSWVGLNRGWESQTPRPSLVAAF